MVSKKTLLMKTFLHLKPVKMLLELLDGPKYATIISKKVDCTYSHTVKLLDIFKESGLVEFEKKGRIKIVKLTEVGEEVARHLQKLVTSLSVSKPKK